MAKRRGNNEGSIYKRHNGTWAGQLSVGNDPATGKPKRKSFYGRTRKEVAEKIAQALQAMKKGAFVEPSRTTFGEWVTHWLVNYKKAQVKATTYENYRVVIDAHIKPALGAIPMAKLQANRLQVYYNEKLANGRTDGKGGLSPGMVRHLHIIIRSSLQQAVKEGLLHRNVADTSSPPTATNKPMRLLTEADLTAFLTATKDDRLFAAYVLAATTGVRRGELLGLCWDCVDLEAGAIRIQRQLLELKDKPLLDEGTKSKSGKRSITLTDDAVRELKAHRKRQLQEKLLLGGAYKDQGLVFCRKNGMPIGPKDFTKRFQQHLQKAGLPKVRLHDLRHTHATLLLQRGIPPKLVQDRLGHASITMTLDLYSHVTPEMQRLAAESLNGLLGGGKTNAKVPADK